MVARKFYFRSSSYLSLVPSFISLFSQFSLLITLSFLHILLCNFFVSFFFSFSFLVLPLACVTGVPFPARENSARSKSPHTGYSSLRHINTWKLYIQSETISACQTKTCRHCTNFVKPLNITSISALKTTITSSIEYLHLFECEADQVLSSTVAWEIKLVHVYAKLLG